MNSQVEKRECNPLLVKTSTPPLKKNPTPSSGMDLTPSPFLSLYLAKIFIMTPCRIILMAWYTTHEKIRLHSASNLLSRQVHLINNLTLKITIAANWGGDNLGWNNWPPTPLRQEGKPHTTFIHLFNQLRYTGMRIKDSTCWYRGLAKVWPSRNLRAESWRVCRLVETDQGWNCCLLVWGCCILGCLWPSLLLGRGPSWESEVLLVSLGPPSKGQGRGGLVDCFSCWWRLCNGEQTRISCK